MYTTASIRLSRNNLPCKIDYFKKSIDNYLVASYNPNSYLVRYKNRKEVVITFQQLKGELVKKGATPVIAIKAAIGCSEKTARNKLNGVTEFTLSEIRKIRDMHLDGFSLEELFTDTT